MKILHASVMECGDITLVKNSKISFVLVSFHRVRRGNSHY